MANKEQSVDIKVRSIKEVAFSIDESYGGEVGSPNIDFNISINVNPLIEEIGLNIALRYCPVENKEISLLSFRCFTNFRVSPFKQFEKVENETSTVDLPNDLMATLLGIAFSHARAVLAMRTAGTRYQDILLPIINPTETINNLFVKNNTTQEA